MESEVDFQSWRALGYHAAVYRNWQQHRVLRFNDSEIRPPTDCWVRRPSSAIARDVPMSIGPRSSMDHFTPRGGFSYQLNNKTVFQGGFSVNFLNGGAYEYGTSKVAVNYGNLLDGSSSVKTTNHRTPAFGNWDKCRFHCRRRHPSVQAWQASSINAFDPNNDGVAPYDVVWNVGVQRELPVQYVSQCQLHR